MSLGQSNQTHQWWCCRLDEHRACIHNRQRTERAALIFYSHSSARLSCFSPSAGGLLARRAAGPRDAQLCRMCSQLVSGATVFTPTEVNLESVLSGHDSQTCSFPFNSRWEADDSQRCVNLPAIVSAFLRRGGKKAGRILLQMAGCNFKSLIVILWHFASPPSEFFCLSESRRLKWGSEQYGIQMPRRMIGPNSVSRLEEDHFPLLNVFECFDGVTNMNKWAA